MRTITVIAAATVGAALAFAAGTTDPAVELPSVGNDPTSLFFLRTFGPSGAIGIVLLYAVRYLANKLADAQKDSMSILTGVVKDNTAALAEVRTVLQGCRAHSAQIAASADKSKLQNLT